MPTKEQKKISLKEAIDITKEYGKGGGVVPAAVLESIYSTLNKIKDDIGDTED